MIRWLRDPLAVYLLAGAGLYLFYYLTLKADDERTIRVGETELLQYVQYRQRSFDAAEATRYLNAMDKPERDKLIAAYVREEALVREARAMGLTNNDYVIRQRLIQKLEYIARGIDNTSESLDEATLRRWYDENIDEYSEPAMVSFTHIYFVDTEAENALQRATSLKASLNASLTPLGDTGRQGDRFLYHVNYIERPLAEVGSHFGDDFAWSVFALKPDSANWQGPLRSKHGHHLVLLTRSAPARNRPFDEVRDMVVYDFKQAEVEARIESLSDDIVKGYKVAIDDD